MKIALRSLMLCSLAALSICCSYAATIVFNVNGSLADGASISGTITINNTTGTATAANLTFGAPDSVNMPLIYGQGLAFFGALPNNYGLGLQNTADTMDFNFVFPTTTLVGYNGGPIADGNLFNLTTNSPGAGIVTMSLSTVSAPEPTSLALIGSGALLGLLLLSQRARLTQ
jgi:hypothetical protein